MSDQGYPPLAVRVCPVVACRRAAAPPNRLWRGACPQCAAPGKGRSYLGGQLHSLRDLAHSALGCSFGSGFTCSLSSTVLSRSAGGTRYSRRFAALLESDISTPGAAVSGG